MNASDSIGNWCIVSIVLVEMSEDIRYKLIEVEQKILSNFTAYKTEFVPIDISFGEDQKIWTISMNYDSDNTPLVLAHGFAAGTGLWCLNLEELAKKRPVYAMDLLGFGRSSRPKFSNDNLEVEKQMIEALEAWRKEMKLEKFILLGHSMGAYLSTLYAISYPERIKHLILADEWGFTDKFDKPSRTLRVLSYILKDFNPLGFLRYMGPYWGPLFLQKTRRDIFGKFSEVLDDENVLPSYVYYCNASEETTGEKAFYKMVSGVGWAKRPLIKRIYQLEDSIPITFLYGSKTWMDSSMGPKVKELRSKSFVDVQIVENAGHHIYSEQAEIFNELVNKACDSVAGVD